MTLIMSVRVGVVRMTCTMPDRATHPDPRRALAT